MSTELLRERVELSYAGHGPLDTDAVETVLGLLDRGALRVAEPGPDGAWVTHAWIMQAILLYFRVRTMTTWEVGPFEFHDKIPLKRDLAGQGVRLVPPGVIRYGAYVERGAVVMPGYVNLGAWVGAGPMVDTSATVACDSDGSCGVVGIGGVLEPPGQQPVIIEDGAFIGSRAIVVEGVRVGEEAVLGANVVLTSSTPIVDVTGPEERVTRGFVPPRSVVIPGTRLRRFPAGEYGVPCALIIGQRTASTDRKTSLNAALRDHGVAV